MVRLSKRAVVCFGRSYGVSRSLSVRLCCDTYLVLKLTKTNTSLKVVVLSASAPLFCDHLCPQCLCIHYQLFLKFLYSSMFHECWWSVFYWRNSASMHIGSIVVSLLVFFYLCETYFSLVSNGSPYLPAAIVSIHSCSELAPTHMSSRSSHWHHSVSFSAVVCL